MLFNFPSSLESISKSIKNRGPYISVEANKAINAHASCDHMKKVVFQYFEFSICSGVFRGGQGAKAPPSNTRMNIITQIV